MASPSDAQHLQIYSSVAFYFFLISFTELSDLFLGEFAIWDVNVFFGNIDVVEQVLSHEVVVALNIILGDRVVLVQVKGHHILEGYLSLLAHSHQLLIYFHWRAPCCQT